MAESGKTHHLEAEASVWVDARGLLCPLPLLRAKKALAKICAGEILAVKATDAAAPLDFRVFCELSGHLLLRVEQKGEEVTLWLQKNPSFAG